MNRPRCLSCGKHDSEYMETVPDHIREGVGFYEPRLFITPVKTTLRRYVVCPSDETRFFVCDNPRCLVYANAVIGSQLLLQSKPRSSSK